MLPVGSYPLYTSNMIRELHESNSYFFTKSATYQQDELCVSSERHASLEDWKKQMERKKLIQKKFTSIVKNR